MSTQKIKYIGRFYIWMRQPWNECRAIRLLNTKSVIEGLKARKIDYFGMDVYEEEKGLFFNDHSKDILQDDVIARLMTFNNVLITSLQAFLTDKALTIIAVTTINKLNCFEKKYSLDMKLD